MPARIVVVHDEAGFVEEKIRAFELAGWDAIGFLDPMIALAELETPQSINLLVTGMQFGRGKPHGISLAMMARTRRPNLKVLFVTAPEFSEDAKRVGECVLLPVDTVALISVVEGILNGPN